MSGIISTVIPPAELIFINQLVSIFSNKSEHIVKFLDAGGGVFFQENGYPFTLSQLQSINDPVPDDVLAIYDFIGNIMAKYN